jgi:hypothetical protein
MKGTVLCSLFIITLTTSFAQSTSKNLFAGSTPCDDWIKAELKISEATPCEFQKWELTLDDANNNQFTLKVRYGMSRPNTNGFQNDGTLLEVKGSFSISNPAGGNRKTIYVLNSASFKSPMMLLKMDNNVFHLLDDKKNLLVGNGGFSYSLNRIN